MTRRDRILNALALLVAIACLVKVWLTHTWGSDLVELLLGFAGLVAVLFPYEFSTSQGYQAWRANQWRFPPDGWVRFMSEGAPIGGHGNSGRRQREARAKEAGSCGQGAARDGGCDGEAVGVVYRPIRQLGVRAVSVGRAPLERLDTTRGGARGRWHAILNGKHRHPPPGRTGGG